MHQSSDDEDDIVNHVPICAEIEECGEWSVSMSTHQLPCVCEPARATIHNSSGVQWWSLIHQVGTIISACLQISQTVMTYYGNLHSHISLMTCRNVLNIYDPH